jgi:hypothetical protein
VILLSQRDWPHDENNAINTNADHDRFAHHAVDSAESHNGRLCGQEINYGDPKMKAARNNFQRPSAQSGPDWTLNFASQLKG